jgi:uncharacterized protein
MARNQARKTQPPVPSGNASRRSAMVTGASSGIGAAFSERLAQDGLGLIIVARRRGRLDALARQLRKQYGIEVEVLVADLTQPSELLAVERKLKRNRTLELLANCAGFAGYMPFVELPPDRADTLIRLHIIALTRLTRAALPGMIARGRGAVINVSSALAFSASEAGSYLPNRAVYAGAKSYIATFTELLSIELEGSGVTVQALCPGMVRTEFHKVAGYDISGVPIVMEPEDVVQASLAALRLSEVICIPSLNRPSVVAEFRRKRSRLFESAGSGALAPRYGSR